MSAGEIAERLEGIYVFSKRLLLEARLERDADKMDLVRGYLTELREAWAQIAGAVTAPGRAARSSSPSGSSTLVRGGDIDEAARRDRSERAALAATLGPPPAGGRPGAGAPRAVQEQIVVELTLARDEIVRELAALRAGAAPCAATAAPPPAARGRRLSLTASPTRRRARPPGRGRAGRASPAAARRAS